MRSYGRRIPYNEYRKRKRTFEKAQEQERLRKEEEQRQQELVWAERGQRLTRAKQEHPVAYFFGMTDTQQEIFGKVSIVNKIFGVGTVSNSNPTGRMGTVTSFALNVVLLSVFFPLLLLASPRQMPALEIVGVAALGIEAYRYERRAAFKHEWKIVLGALTILGWTVFLYTLRLP